MLLRLRDRTVELAPGRPLIMGIVNAAPGSFSGDGGAGAAQRGLALIEEGADLIDVGGEPGVTGVEPLPAAEEAERVIPVVEELVRAGAAVSVDTWKPEVARAALAAGAVMLNDVSGLGDPALADACAATGAALVVMHTRAAPKAKEFPGFDDVAADVERFLRERIALACERGVGDDQIVVDPGPDFGKTPAETVAALRALPTGLGRPVLLAVSRKDFVGALTGRGPRERLGGTLAAVGAGVDAGASILRVHDVAAVADFLAVRAALRGEREVPGDLRLPLGLRIHPS